MELLRKLFAKMYNWNCSKCNTTIQKETTPNTSGCSKGGNHQWHRL
jgi:hypothetical protein